VYNITLAVCVTMVAIKFNVWPTQGAPEGICCIGG